jgi:hypothetical protein
MEISTMNEIVKGDFEEWSKNKLVEYASISIPHAKQKGVTSRLIFGVFIGGGYKVTLGYDTIYEGGSFSEAQGAFHQAQLKVADVK